MKTVAYFAFLAGLFGFLADAAWATDVAKQQGPARRWGAGMQVTPYSAVNLETGRVTTTVDFVGWSGRGPAVSFQLYHNQPLRVDEIGVIESDPLELPLLGDANLDGAVDADDIPAFAEVVVDPDPTPDEVARCDMNDDLEADGGDIDGFQDLLSRGGAEEGTWSHSYSRHLVFFRQDVYLVWDDGTQDRFVWNAGTQSYAAPAGVFWSLVRVWDAQAGGYLYTFTSKHLEQMRFDPAGKLTWLADASGNEVTCAYIDDPQSAADGKLQIVQDAAGRQLVLAYNRYGKLMTVTDPIGRFWVLHYEDAASPPSSPDGEGRLVKVETPGPHQVSWTYTDTGDLDGITDKNGNTWGLTFSHGRLLAVQDPAPLSTGGQFLYIPVAWDQSGNVGLWEVRYTDRRGQVWKCQIDGGPGHLQWWQDPLGHRQTVAYGDQQPPLVHEVTAYRDALNHAWTVAYDAAGNVTSAADPEGHAWTYAYDSVNNLTGVTPPGETGQPNLAKQVAYAYDDQPHPTNVTQIVLPADGQGNDAATIDLAYYDADDAPADPPWTPAAWNGLLKTVTDANGVGTLFEYDLWGQVWRTSEGDAAEPGFDNKVVQAQGVDVVGRVFTDLGRFTLGYPSWEGGSGGGDRYCIIRPTICSIDPCTGAVECGYCVAICVGSFCRWYDPCGGQTMGEPPPEQEGGEVGFTPPRFLQYPGCAVLGVGGELTGSANWEYSTAAQEFSAHSTIQDTSLFGNVFNWDVIEGYDPLGRRSFTSVTSNEPSYDTSAWSSNIVRGFGYTYDDTTGAYTRTGPDGQTTQIQADVAGRVESITRAGMSATYTYYNNDAVHTVTYGNGSRTVYNYYPAGAVQRIRHEWAGDHSVILQLLYTYSADGLIQTVTETGPDGWAAVVTYTYDNRNRLIDEQRVGTHPYHLSYAYDQMGNRLTKVDHLAGSQTAYYYDVHDPVNYDTRNNRLMAYEVYQGGNLVETVEYVYDPNNPGGDVGHPTFMVRKRAAEQVYQGTTLQYNKRGELWIVSRQSWQEGDEDCETLVRERIWEFRGSGRARYLVRERDPLDPPMILPGTSTWSDYDGDEIYADYVMDAQTGLPIEKMAHLPGLGELDSQSGAVTYHHADHLGTLRATTNQQSAVSATLVYTAFGELVFATGDPATRYQYAGAWGYESDLGRTATPGTGVPWQHVGFRWYSPSTGRFLQRDPIGIRGGFNIYRYVGNNPLLWLDPLGLTTPDWGRFVARLTGGGLGTGAGAVIGYAICVALSIGTGGLGGLVIIGVAGGAGAVAGVDLGEAIYDDPRGAATAGNAALRCADVLMDYYVVWPAQKALNDARKFIDKWGHIVLYD